MEKQVNSMNQTSIACVIVTFNRKELLCQCIEAVLHQKYRPATIYIVNNASTDGTEEVLLQKGYIQKSFLPNRVEECVIKYIPLNENIGGAGGFYTGMKAAFEDGIDAIWVMDDDGIPEVNCLHSLVRYLGRYDYVAPMVLDIEDSQKMSFEYCGERVQFEQQAVNGLVQGIACPFNGILYSRHLIETIGFPKKEMFIWGDEENYNARAVKAGLNPVTVIGAIHRHPTNRVQTDDSIFGKIDVAPQMWRCYCRYRNAIYNHKDEMGILGKTFVFINHIYYYFIKKHSWKWTKCYIDAFLAGYRGDFTGLSKYMNK